jgi:hypothetical protein
MDWYEVRGRIFQHHVCDCPHCEYDGEEVTIIRKVQAYDAEDAEFSVLRYAEDDHGDTCEWVDPPETRLLGEDLVMRLNGAPMLPGLAEAVTTEAQGERAVRRAG